MSKKKVLLTILAVMLVCCIAVTGTLAFLTKESAQVTNTFVAAGGGELADTFELKEHIAEKQADGNYALGDTETTDTVTGTNYSVVPGVNLPKDPYVKVTGKTDAPAYMYIEVVDGLANTGLSYTLESCWADTGLTGSHNGKIYVYSDANGAVILNEDTDQDLTVGILVDDEVVVADGDAFNLTDTQVALSFYGYLAQANAGNGAASAFTACFSTAE